MCLEEFVEGAMRLKGVAKSIDVHGIVRAGSRSRGSHPAFSRLRVLAHAIADVFLGIEIEVLANTVADCSCQG